MRCFLLPARGKWCRPGFESYYQKAYNFWHEICKKALESQGFSDKALNLTADDFVNQEECVCLFHEEKAIGLFMFNWIDLQHDAARKRQYFLDHYPASILDKLAKEHPFLMIMSQLMVHPDWRKKQKGYYISDLLLDFTVQRLLESPATAVAAISRNNRKTHELSYRHGAEALAKNVAWYGMEADILMIRRELARSTDIPGIANISQALWKEKIIASSYQPFPEKIFSNSIGK